MPFVLFSHKHSRHREWLPDFQTRLDKWKPAAAAYTAFREAYTQNLTIAAISILMKCWIYISITYFLHVMVLDFVKI